MIDGRVRREQNRKEHGRYLYEKMIARYESECKLLDHYYIDTKTGERIEKEEDIESNTEELHE